MCHSLRLEVTESSPLVSEFGIARRKELFPGLAPKCSVPDGARGKLDSTIYTGLTYNDSHLLYMRTEHTGHTWRPDAPTY